MPFSAIPHQSKLFLDYLRDPSSLRRFYPDAVKSYSGVSAFIPKVLSNYKTDRNALCDALAGINSAIGAGEKCFQNISLLREADTVAVVTGQQAGLFTGPLYTIYKALSAIKMAEHLNADGFAAVPVFWVATEDHDFDEVSKTYFIGNAGELVKAEYRPSDYVRNLPVGSIKVDGSIDEVMDQILNALSQTEFSADVRRAIEGAWSDGVFFGNAFAKNLAAILEKFGLIIIDPMHPTIKSLAAPIYVAAIEKSSEIVANIRRKSSELEADGYHTQVLVEEDYFPFFRIDDDGRRMALRKTGEDIYSAKEEKRKFSLAELTSIAKDDPQRFSPGVMLRPVVQDHLLPTVCYFGGAAEIAYFAQNSEAYRILERPITPILHRQSFTVVEAKHTRTLEKFGLGFSDLFTGFEQTLEGIGKKQLSSETANIFASAEEKICAELDRLDQNLSLIDATLVENLAKRRRKIMYHIAALKKKAYFANIRKDETLQKQIRSAFYGLLPNRELQERVLNVNSFLNKYGPYFIDLIYEAIDLNDKDHRVIHI